eukprot:Colp12_sorted_trinity150504_noHs@31376
MATKEDAPTGIAGFISNFDAFPKVLSSYKQSTTTGGTVSLIAFIIISVLVTSEFFAYRDIDTAYSYKVDPHPEGALDVNLDITIAMRCHDLGADVLDVSGIQRSDTLLQKSEAHFELAENQKEWLRHVRERVAGLADVQVDSLVRYASLRHEMPPPEVRTTPPDACRIHGVISVSKVAGNFHITAGRSVPSFRGHAHDMGGIANNALNFTHRIDRLSFGPDFPGIVSPLDGIVKSTSDHLQMYQYMISIVPTVYRTVNGHHLDTNQYSVAEHARSIDHTGGSHGVAGIFFKYDFFSVMVEIEEQRTSFLHFLVRLCGIIGGTFATSGYIHYLLTQALATTVKFRRSPSRQTSRQLSKPFEDD